MLPSLAETIINLAQSLLIAVLTAFLTVRLSLRRFRAERWWERKAEAYSKIVEALHNAMEYCAAMSDEEQMGSELSDERKKRLTDDYLVAVQEIKKATGIGAFIISSDVADVLSKLDARPRPDPNKTAFWEIFDDAFDAYRTALMHIRELAKKDLEVSN